VRWGDRGTMSPARAIGHRVANALWVLLLAVQPGFIAGACEAADNVVVWAEKQGSAVAIEARAVLTAPLPLIWETLTDYDRLAVFIPGMQVSQVLERRGAASIVKQKGEAAFLFFTHSIDVVVEALEKPPYLIEIRVLSGNLKRLDGRYQIEPDAKLPGNFLLRWSGSIEADTNLPAMLGVPILRANINDQFRGMVREIERRVALARAELKNE
jgi:Polyketide cyclase / dehydrase and lipid transport